MCRCFGVNLFIYGFITNEIRIPPLPTAGTESKTKYAESIDVLYTNDPSAAVKWYEKYVPDDELTTIGFDVESNPIAPWVKIKFEGPATVQLSVVQSALVLHLVHDDGSPSNDAVPFLQNVLSNSKVLKAGVGIDQDMLELVRYWKSPPMSASKHKSPITTISDVQGRFDIGGIGGKNGETLSLKRLATGVLGVDMPKSRKVAISNWGKIPLEARQIAYAARDAWTAAAIMHEMAILNKATFGTDAISDLLIPNEVPITELDDRAAARKVAKLQYLDIVGRGETRVYRKDLSDAQLEQVIQLEAKMKELAPPRPYRFDVQHLGLTL